MFFIGALDLFLLVSWLLYIVYEPTMILSISVFLSTFFFISTLLLYCFSVFISTAILGLTLAVTVLIFLFGLTNSFFKNLDKNIVSSSGHVWVYPEIDWHIKNKDQIEENFRPVGDFLRQKKLIHQSSISWTTAVVARKKYPIKNEIPSWITLNLRAIEPSTSIQKDFLMKSIKSELEKQKGGTEKSLSSILSVSSSLQSKEMNPRILVGATLAKTMQLSLGDVVEFMNASNLSNQIIKSEQAYQNEMQRLPAEFVVAGIFETGFSPLDSEYSFIDLKEAFKRLPMDTGVFLFEILLQDPNQIKTIKDFPNSQFKVISYQELNYNLYQFLAMQKAAVYMILFFAILASSFNLLSSIGILILEKEKEIAILKSMGMSVARISSIFRWISLQLFLIGTILGIIFGLMVCFLFSRIEFKLNSELYLIGSLSSDPSLKDILFIAITAFFWILFVTQFPLRRIRKLSPAEVMRSDGI